MRTGPRSGPMPRRSLATRLPVTAAAWAAVAVIRSEPYSPATRSLATGHVRTRWATWSSGIGGGTVGAVGWCGRGTPGPAQVVEIGREVGPQRAQQLRRSSGLGGLIVGRLADGDADGDQLTAPDQQLRRPDECLRRAHEVGSRQVVPVPGQLGLDGRLIDEPGEVGLVLGAQLGEALPGRRVDPTGDRGQPGGGVPGGQVALPDPLAVEEHGDQVGGAVERAPHPVVGSPGPLEEPAEVAELQPGHLGRRAAVR